MKKIFKVLAIVAVIGFSFIACDNGDNGTEGGDGKKDPIIDTTALNAVIQEALIARDGVETASNASEVPTGKKWVTESEWNAFDTVIKTAAEAKANPSSQSAVDTAKTNLQTAIVTFNNAKKNGSGSAITLSGTITVKNNGQIVPYVLLQAYAEDWSWQEMIRIPATAANSPWKIITSPFSSSTVICFVIHGYNNDKYEDKLFEITATEKATAYNTNVTNITINMNLNLITISGTLNLNYGKVIPSISISIYKGDDTMLGATTIVNAGNNTPWSIMLPSQAVDTDITFSVVGFDGPLPWEYDQLFAFWRKDFGVKIKNQNKTGIALNLIVISGTVNVTYNGNRVPSVTIYIFEKSGEDWEWFANTELHSPSANATWSFVMPTYTSDKEIRISVLGSDESGNDLFWNDVTTKTVKNTNVSGIALNLGNITD